MFNFSQWSLGSAALLVLGITAGAVAPLNIATPASAQPAFFSDTRDYWGRPFIVALARENLIAGYPDVTYKPNQPVDRAEFATMIQKAFDQNQVREIIGFTDVPADHWAASAVESAYKTGFMAGYRGNLFFPNLEITKVQALVALASGLGLTASQSPAADLNTYYTDAEQIPGYATNEVAAATAANLVVNYPNVKALNPNELLTRGEAAALLHQALVKQGKLPPLASNEKAAKYIAGPSAK